MAYFLLYFFFADKMHFKLPKLDGFKITVILVLDCYRGVSTRMVTPEAEFCGVTLHNVQLAAGTPTRTLLREDLCPKDIFLSEKFLNDAV